MSSLCANNEIFLEQQKTKNFPVSFFQHTIAFFCRNVLAKYGTYSIKFGAKI